MKTWKSYIKERLREEKLITLSTISENITWSSPMYFASDAHLNIYVLLDTVTQHMKNISFFKKASVSIAAENKTNLHIQIVGNVEILDKQDALKIPEIYQQLYQQHTGDFESLNNSTSLDWRLVKIQPVRIFLVNPQDSKDKQEIAFSESFLSSFTN